MHKALFVHLDFLKLGGAEAYGLHSAKAIAKAGVETRLMSIHAPAFACPTVCGLSHFGAMPPIVLLRKIYTRLTRILSYGDLCVRLSLSHCSKDVDLLICGHILCLPSVVSEARRRNIPVWLLAYGIDVWREWTIQEKRDIEACECVVSISHFTVESVRRRLPIGWKGEIVLIPPAVDTNFFTPIEHQTEAEVLRILTVSRLSSLERYKGQDLVIKAMPHLLEHLSTAVEYQIIGDGDDRERLERLSKEVGVSDVVRFSGRLSDEAMLEAYRNCHVFAMPSYVSRRNDGSWTGEGFGIVYIEAAACGKPVLACDVGGQVDCVRHGETGILVKPTFESVQLGLVEILSDIQKARQMGMAGRKFVLENFSRDHFNRRWAELIDKKVS